MTSQICKPSNPEFQSILRSILFPTRRLIRHIDENYSILCITKNEEKSINHDDISKDKNYELNNLLKELSLSLSSADSSDVNDFNIDHSSYQTGI